MPRTKFGLNLTYHSGADMAWRFSRWPPWRPPSITKRTILTILNLYVALMPPIKFQLNLTLGLGGDVIWKFSSWRTLWPSWIVKWNDFSNSNTQCSPNASHQVWAQSNLGFGSRCDFKIFKMAWYLGYHNGTILAILNLHVATMPPTKFQLNPTWFWRRCRKCEKLTMDGWRTDDRQTDRWGTTGHGIRWPRAKLQMS